MNNLPSFQAWHNYHQNFDLSSLAGKIPLRGDELIDEWIENYKFTESDFEEVAKTRAKELPYILYTAHKHVQFTARVTQLIYNLLLTNP